MYLVIVCLLTCLYFLIDKEKGTICSNKNGYDWLKNLPFELLKYVIDKELHHTDDLMFLCSLFVLCYINIYNIKKSKLICNICQL